MMKDGYKFLKENPQLREVIERLAKVKIVFEEKPKEEDKGK